MLFHRVTSLCLSLYSFPFFLPIFAFIRLPMQRVTRGSETTFSFFLSYSHLLVRPRVSFSCPFPWTIFSKLIDPSASLVVKRVRISRIGWTDENDFFSFIPSETFVYVRMYTALSSYSYRSRRPFRVHRETKAPFAYGKEPNIRPSFE